jgi:hypothetical protein
MVELFLEILLWFGRGNAKLRVWTSYQSMKKRLGGGMGLAQERYGAAELCQWGQ